MAAHALTASSLSTGPQEPRLLPLNLLPSGHSARVEAILGKDEQAHRLQEMGLCLGATIRMVQPGSSCIVCLGNRKLCFRAGEAVKVLVQTGVGA